VWHHRIKANGASSCSKVERQPLDAFETVTNRPVSFAVRSASVIASPNLQIRSHSRCGAPTCSFRDVASFSTGPRTIPASVAMDIVSALRELTGVRSARRGAFRILYEIDDVIRLVTVLCVEHRADVYRPR
jgi:hypothetical protein